MHRRDALKTLGLTATAIATLDGETLAKPDELPTEYWGDPIKTLPQMQYRCQLGWYGFIESDIDFTLERCNSADKTGFKFNHKSNLISEFISDQTIHALQNSKYPVVTNIVWYMNNQYRTIKYCLYPKPSEVKIIYLYERLRYSRFPQAVLVQSWDKDIFTNKTYDFYSDKLVIANCGEDQYWSKCVEVKDGIFSSLESTSRFRPFVYKFSEKELIIHKDDKLAYHLSIIKTPLKELPIGTICQLDKQWVPEPTHVQESEYEWVAAHDFFSHSYPESYKGNKG